jgi:hypothetical protein
MAPVSAITALTPVLAAAPDSSRSPRPHGRHRQMLIGAPLAPNQASFVMLARNSAPARVNSRTSAGKMTSWQIATEKR